MSTIVEQMQAAIFKIGDESVEYSQKDFNREFGANQATIVVDADINKKVLAFKNDSTNEDPTYATVGSSGFDLRANLLDGVAIMPNQIKIIPTGLFFSIPENFEIQIRPRSGLAAKNGVTVLNTPGTIDADYTGEVKIILINLGDKRFIVNHGDRIAQGVFSPVYSSNSVKLTNVDEIASNGTRGDKGFGSTGVS
jgi:dUTP pyrophosphatase